MMVKLKIIITFFVFSNLISCQERKQENIIVDKRKENFKKSNYFDEDRIKNDKYNIKYNGDIHSYSELVLYYSYNESRKEELLPYSLIIVEKYKQYNFCSDVFIYLIEFYSEKKFIYDGSDKSLINYFKKLESLNLDQINYALYFLKLGAINSDRASIMNLEKIYRNGIGIEKNIKKADSLNIVLSNLK